MRKEDTVTTFAIPFEILGYNSRNGHSNSNEAIMIDSDPNYVKPGQATGRCSPATFLAAAALGKPIQWPHPRLDRAHMSEEFLLVVQVGCDIMAHERKERGDGEGLIAVAENLEIDGMPVIPYT